MMVELWWCGTATYAQSTDLDEIIEDTSAKLGIEEIHGNVSLNFSIVELEGSHAASNCQRVLSCRK